MTTGIDISEWQAPGSVNFGPYAFVIIRTSHGMTEDKAWRLHFNAAVAAGRSIGLYHYAEHNVPENEASFFHGLAGFLTPEQCRMGWWLDVEEGQDSTWADRFRAWVHLPTIGVYSNLAGFNGPLRAYMHFGLNWLAWPSAPSVPAGYAVPDHILRQTGQAGGVDTDVMQPAQPMPLAWQ